eukprot:TRINITY_DN19681_c0_g1_i1.p1 TRINITY_DN19681_c0_g1~~TRINITY_DN19681_c0_g1_i1.p1  ORF type:complete len:329 (+),score=90.39 TRINITY_DN19681_c0_g1_i1:55-987(+)
MVLFPRLPLRAVGVHRFRDTLVNENGRYLSVVWTLKNNENGKVVTVAPAHTGAHPRYFRELEEMMASHDGVGQIMHREGIVEPVINTYPDEPTDDQHIILPKTWGNLVTPLYGIDNDVTRVITDWNSVVFGHIIVNPRGAHCYSKAKEAMEQHSLHSMMLPVSPFHVPTVLKKLEDDGFTIIDERKLEVVRLEETGEIAKRVVPMSMFARLNFISNDFFPSIGLLVFAIFLAFAPAQDPYQQPHGYNQAYPPQYQQQYYPQQYQPQQYPQYPPPGHYPPQGHHYGPPQGYSPDYNTSPPPPPGTPYRRSE